MKLDEWRAMQAGGEEATLPSGLEIRVKYVSVLDLALAGAIPQTLAGKVEQIMKGGQVRSINLKEFKEFAELNNLVCAECIVSPGRDELEVTELPYLDRVSVFNWANQAKRLEPFRRQQSAAVESALDSDDVREPAIQHPGANGRVGSVPA